MDNEIRELAKLHGRDTLSDDEVTVIRQKLANAYVDGLLDAPPELPKDD